MRPSLRFLGLAVAGWLGVRAAAIGILPGAELFRIERSEAKTPPIVPTQFPPIEPVALAPAEPASLYPAQPYLAQPYGQQPMRPVMVAGLLCSPDLEPRDRADAAIRRIAPAAPPRFLLLECRA